MSISPRYSGDAKNVLSVGFSDNRGGVGGHKAKEKGRTGAIVSEAAQKSGQLLAPHGNSGCCCWGIVLVVRLPLLHETPLLVAVVEYW